MSSRWFLVLLLVPLLSSIAFSQKLIDGFTREFAIQGLPAGISLKSFDVTGDSVSELFVLTGSQLQVFDGRSFSLIFKDSAAPGTNNLNQADVNRDGSTDLVANSKDTAIVVWYGPDFSIRSFFPTPRRGFGVFAVRNREDGQVEFNFGFSQTFSGSCPTSTRSGYLLRFVDTTFIAFDSIYLVGAPTMPTWIEPVKVSNSTDIFLVSNELYDGRSCSPSQFRQNFRFQRFHLDVLSGFMFYNYSCFFTCPPAVWCWWSFAGRPTVGNIDLDDGPELIVKVEEWHTPSCLPSGRYIVAYDILTSTMQFSHGDPAIYFRLDLFVLDINRDGVDELLSYQVINGKPGFVEYQTSSGDTLGSTEFPFSPSTFLASQFGDPPAPRVLLGHGDSLIVYRICSATTKGDLNADGDVTIFDVTLELNCAFLGEGDCNLCFADVNCDGVLSAVDVVLELLAVFLQRPFPCS